MKKGEKESPRASNITDSREINWRHPLHRNSSGDLAKWEREKSVRCQGGLLFVTCLERRQNVRVVFNLSTWHSLPKITSSSIIEIDPPSGADVFKNSCSADWKIEAKRLKSPFASSTKWRSLATRDFLKGNWSYFEESISGKISFMNN